MIGAFPLFRKLHKQKKYIHLVFDELSKIYGPIMGIKLGRQKFIVISGNKLAKKILNDDKFNGRPDGFFFRVRSFGKRIGIVFSDGHVWSQLRQLAVKNLRTHGFGQVDMNKYLKIEGEELLKFLHGYEKNIDKPFLMNEVFDVPIFNSIWTIMTGNRFSYDDKKLEDIMFVIHDAFR